MEFDKLLVIEHVISPSIFCNPNYLDQIDSEIKNKYRHLVHEKHFIMYVISTNTHNVSYAKTDPISGCMVVYVDVTCKCLDIKPGDILSIDITNIVTKGFQGICYDGSLKASVSDVQLKGWTFCKGDDNNKNTWEKNGTKIKCKMFIDIEVTNTRYKKDNIECVAKLVAN